MLQAASPQASAYRHRSASPPTTDWYVSPTGSDEMAGPSLTVWPAPGVNFIFYFGTSYFQNSGIKNPFIISVITDVVNVSSTVPGLYLVEKWGRRPLLMFGAIGKFHACHRGGGGRR